jgi:TRAP-type C4-dicarboxylate transport system substrate-binding protein
MSKKIEKDDSWDDLTDDQKNEIQQEINESNKKKKVSWEDVKKELLKLK